MSLNSPSQGGSEDAGKRSQLEGELWHISKGLVLMRDLHPQV